MPPIVISADGSYQWDKAKEAINRRKHGVGFAEAGSVLAYPRADVAPDGGGMGVLRAIGFSRQGRMLTVAFEPRGERDHIISARPSTPEELREFGDTDGE